MNDWKTPSRSSPQGGGTRACLCPNGTYSKKCCDGSLQAQGIGPITRVDTYLLDIYKDASIAFSLRQLIRGFSGPILTIRRASDSTELDVYFVNGVVDSQAIIDFCSGTNGYVKTWYDQSGNGKNATAPTTAAQPKIYDISLGYLGYIQFGGQQYFTTTLAYDFDGLVDIYQVIQANGSGVYGRTNSTTAYFGIYFNGGTSITYTGFDQYYNKVNDVTIGTTADALHDATVNRSLFTVRARSKQSRTIWIGAPFNSAYNNQRFTEYIMYKNQDRGWAQVIAAINEYYKLF